jgi:hypothetical protein
MVFIINLTKNINGYDNTNVNGIFILSANGVIMFPDLINKNRRQFHLKWNQQLQNGISLSIKLLSCSFFINGTS